MSKKVANFYLSKEKWPSHPYRWVGTACDTSKEQIEAFYVMCEQEGFSRDEVYYKIENKGGNNE